MIDERPLDKINQREIMDRRLYKDFSMAKKMGITDTYPDEIMKLSTERSKYCELNGDLNLTQEDS